MSATAALAGWWTHTVSVKRATGATATGPGFASPVSLSCFVDPGNRQVSTPSGDTVVSSARVFLPAGTADIPVGSLVTLPASFGGHEATVVASAARSSGMGTPDHVELSLQ